LRQILCGKILARDDHDRRVGRDADRREVAQRIVLGTWNKYWSRNMRAHAGGKQRVAVRRGRRDPRRTDTAAGPTDSLDDERLAKNSAHLLADDAGDDIACAAG